MSMSFRAIDGAGDWSFGSGRGNYFRDAAAIAANVRTRLLFWLNDCFFALEDGVDWRNLLGGKRPAAEQAIVLQCRTVIIESFGVVKIVSVTSFFATAPRRLTVNYTIDTIFSRGVAGRIQL